MPNKRLKMYLYRGALMSKQYLVMLLLTSLLISGCNAFEGFDRNVKDSDFPAIVGEARLALAAADYDKARELFDRAISEYGADNEVWRGRAASLAGLAGFNMFNVLDIMQNSALPANSAAVIFKASLTITDPKLLEEAITDMERITQPGNDDRMFRSLMRALAAARSLLAIYDTNLNNELDTPDQINFDATDATDQTWQQLYLRFTDLTSGFSLERAFVELTQALDGRGDEWITVSPVQGTSYTGRYTPANRSLILAVGNFADILQQADAWFDLSEDNFKSQILSLDGAN